MARLYDRLMAKGFSFPMPLHESIDATMHERLARCLAHAEVIKIDNVADYFYFDARYGQFRWAIQDFPNLASPFPLCFLEYTVPNITSDRIAKHLGVLLCTEEITPDDRERIAMAPPSAFAPTDDARWIVHAFMFGQGAKTNSLTCAGRARYYVNARGEFTDSVGGVGLSFNCFFDTIEDIARLEGEDAEIRFALVMGYVHLYPSFLALSFLHCKNVKRVENLPPPKLSKAYHKRHGRPLVKYYTLEIDPMKEVLRREGKSEEVGLKKALHLCRGHFADYREGKGLFGKHHGIYWWDSHVRGAIQQGAVVKDYAVKAPKGVD